MSNIITPELVRRYLKSTGRRDGSTFERLIASHQLEVVVQHMGIDRAELGMLAAAEHEREQMNAIHNRDMITISREERIRIDERRRSYQDLLTLAGVDPNAWEATR